MTVIATLHDLMVHELKDLYSAEKQLVQALPKMETKATSVELREAIRTHLGQTEQHVTRLEEAFNMLGITAEPVKCKAMEGIIKECRSCSTRSKPPMHCSPISPRAESTRWPIVTKTCNRPAAAA